jgi:uncharacterized protein (DUF58 family)
METSRLSRADLFDPATITSLGRIEIIARWIVDGFMTGLHRSPRRGFSVEFADHRPYQVGDDLRYVDWKIAARADRWVVKQFEEETNLRATIVLDVSRSMAWSGSPLRITKLTYAETLCAALALILIRQRDAVGLIRFDNVVRTALPPRARSAHWKRIVAALSDPGAGKGSLAGRALNDAARMVRRPGMVVLVSDLLMDVDEVVRAVRSLRALGHDVTVLHIMDPDERNLSIPGDALLVDPETDLEVPATIADVRDAYRTTVEHAIAEWRSSLAGAGASYATVLTDSPFAVPLRRAFAAREKLP